ncbi:histidine kinase [Aerosakkonema funiforme]|uniref:Histidine kinase n=1 Tax=Aerosakkonema funiforme FACHB-1375 TaxID=2949571 RepID=A0A926VA47_9CYAN|nr:histidine kinase [Aerosakkonema funiforme]MBD2179598.1 histidine kinase [Aerosakkonema funiforme FACHB-1375]
MPTSCHIVVEGNPVIVYASRNGTPNKVLLILEPFLEKFWQERETCGEYCDTPECLVAQIVVRFGYEICEDDFSNLRVGVNYDPNVEYIYSIGLDRSLNVWVPEADYRSNPTLGLKGCRQLATQVC